MPSGSGHFKTSYECDMAIFDTPFRRFWLIVLVVALVIYPFITTSYLAHMANLVFIYAIVALALNLLTGYAGLISLGHAGLFAAGGYTVATLATSTNLPFWLVLPAAIVVGIILGFIMGLPALRLRALYFILGTVAMHFILIYAGNRYQTQAGFKWGITVPSPTLGPLVLDNSTQWYFLLLITLILVTVFCVNLVRTRVGRTWIAVRDRDVAAQALGLDISYHKLVAFMVSGALTALAGGLYTYYSNFITSETFTLWLGITFVAMIAIGGLGSILGSFLGAVFVTLLPYAISGAMAILPVPQSMQVQRASIELILFGFFIALFVILEPTGLVGIWIRIRTFFELWPFKYKRTLASTK